MRENKTLTVIGLSCFLVFATMVAFANSGKSGRRQEEHQVLGQRRSWMGTIERGPCGNLFIDSKPADASIYIDNRLVGKTPVFLRNVPAGSHQLCIRRKGYLTYRRPFRLAARQDLGMPRITLVSALRDLASSASPTR